MDPPVRAVAALPMVERSLLERRLMAILKNDIRPATRRTVLIPAVGAAALTLAVAAAHPVAPASPIDVPADSQVAAPPAPNASSSAASSGTTCGEAPGDGGAAGRRGPRFGVLVGRLRLAVLQRQYLDERHGRPRRHSRASRHAGIRPRDSEEPWRPAALHARGGPRSPRGRRAPEPVARPSEPHGARSAARQPRAAARSRAARRCAAGFLARRLRRTDVRRRGPAMARSHARDVRHHLGALPAPRRGQQPARGDLVDPRRGEQPPGEISSLRGEVSSMRGRISSIHGEESSLRGEISSIRGHVSSLQGAISSERGAISSLNASRYQADAAERDQIASRARRHEARNRPRRA